jgi:hypothetical protein
MPLPPGIQQPATRIAFLALNPEPLNLKPL